jgi:hypothetical protein
MFTAVLVHGHCFCPRTCTSSCAHALFMFLTVATPSHAQIGGKGTILWDPIESMYKV